MHPRKHTSPEPELLKLKYHVGKVIGTGKFSVVKECLERATKVKYALKVICKVAVKKEYEAVKKEVVMLRATQHCNIIRLHQEVLSDNHHFLVLEFANNGDLFELISEQGSFSEHDVTHMLNDVISGVSYLHSLNICHRDIKPENILVHRLGLSKAYHDCGVVEESYTNSTSNHNNHHGNGGYSYDVTGNRLNNQNMQDEHDNTITIHNTFHNNTPANCNNQIDPPDYSNYNNSSHNNDNSNNDLQQQYSINNDIVLKIADLGFATFASEPLLTVCGTPAYVAPEVIAETGYGLKVDVWSSGVLAYILLCGFPPFDSEIDDQDELFDLISTTEADLQSVPWDRIGDEAKLLVSSMLLKNPEARPSAVDIYKHPWVKRHRDSQGSPSSSMEVEEVESMNEHFTLHNTASTSSNHSHLPNAASETHHSSSDTTLHCTVTPPSLSCNTNIALSPALTTHVVDTMASNSIDTIVGDNNNDTCTNPNTDNKININIDNNTATNTNIDANSSTNTTETTVTNKKDINLFSNITPAFKDINRISLDSLINAIELSNIPDGFEERTTASTSNNAEDVLCSGLELLSITTPKQLIAADAIAYIDCYTFPNHSGDDGFTSKVDDSDGKLAFDGDLVVLNTRIQDVDDSNDYGNDILENRNVLCQQDVDRNDTNYNINNINNTNINFKENYYNNNSNENINIHFKGSYCNYEATNHPNSQIYTALNQSNHFYCSAPSIYHTSHNTYDPYDLLNDANHALKSVHANTLHHCTSHIANTILPLDPHQSHLI